MASSSSPGASSATPLTLSSSSAAVSADARERTSTKVRAMPARVSKPRGLLKKLSEAASSVSGSLSDVLSGSDQSRKAGGSSSASSRVTPKDLARCIRPSAASTPAQSSAGPASVHIDVAESVDSDHSAQTVEYDDQFAAQASSTGLCPGQSPLLPPPSSVV